MNYLIYGLSKSGKSCTRLLNTKDNVLYLFDDDRGVLEKAKKEYASFNNVKVLREISEITLQIVDEIIVSPSISKNNKIILEAREIGVPVISELELGARLFKGTLVAITGTNGKTTTVELVYHILKSAKKEVEKVGNVGIPITSKIDSHTKKSIFVCEVSSFQLEHVSKLHAHISAILNITPDHLNRYDSFSDYANTKLNITINQTKKDYLILSKDQNVKGEAKIFRFGRKAPNSCFIKDGYFVFKRKFFQKKICNVSTCEVHGQHNLENIMTAILIAKLLKIKNKYIFSALKTFKFLSHRGEKVKEINNISFYDDSKATNVDATLKALDTFKDKQNFILILGGSDKNYSYDEIFRHLPKSIKKIIAMGDVCDKIYRAWKDLKINVPLERVDSLKEAVMIACEDLRKNEALLLSPASASLNEFKNYSERGDFFKKYVEEYYEGEK